MISTKKVIYKIVQSISSLKTSVAGIVDTIYPVGSYLWTSDGSFDPNVTFGGTWEKMDEGLVLVSAGTNYTISAGTSKDGGAATVTLNSTQIPSHAHTINNDTRFLTTTASGDGVYGTTVASGSGAANILRSLNGIVRIRYTDAIGGGLAHENMPPYKNAYCWHRTA